MSVVLPCPVGRSKGFRSRGHSSTDQVFLILDDALSAVDTHTEEEILKNLRDATTSLTVLVISHRISSVKDADYIYVLEEGRLVEEGTHQELRRKKGLYENLYQMQLLEAELDKL